MRNFVLFVSASLVSVSVYAAQVNSPVDAFTNAVSKSLSTQSNTPSSNSAIVYGGKDISHPMMASAGVQGLKQNQPVMVG